jgi:succinate dehydrogenase hydrophobic anchor subunit
MRVKQIHRLTAVILGIFILSHLGVHLTALISKETHFKALDIVQVAYRHPVMEALLVIAILTQIITGFKRLRLKRKLKDKWARLQVASGLYLIFFLLNHTGAALYTHHIFEVETDFYWAAGSLQISPIKYGFAIYYFLAVLSVFVHLAAALHFGWKGSSPRLEKAISISGALVAGLIIFGFWGVLYDVTIPADMMAYFEKNFGFLGLSQ